jgi:hypothetical protein
MRDRAREFLSRHERFQGFASVDELAAQMELLAQHGLDVLNERLIESPEEQVLDNVVEHNVGATLARLAFRELAYEPKGLPRPTDLVGMRGGRRYQFEVKRLAAPEIDRRQHQALKEVRRQIQSVLDPVWLGLVVTEAFGPEHAGDLVKSIRKAAKDNQEEPSLPERALVADDFAFVDYLWEYWSAPGHRDAAHLAEIPPRERPEAVTALLVDWLARDAR